MLALIAHRGYIWRAAMHDFRNRYAGTTVGFMWNVIHPLAMILLFTVIFSTLMPISFESGGTRYPFVLYLCCGLLPWLAFADCVGRTTSAFVDNAPFLKRLPLPEQVFVAKTALSSGLNLALYYVILIVLSILAGHFPQLEWIFIAPIGIALILFGYGIGLALSVLNTFFRDVAQFVQVALQIALWAAPITYVEAAVPEWTHPLLKLNPFYWFLAGFREAFLYDRPPSGSAVIGMTAWTVTAIVIGNGVARRLGDEMRDVL
jgi:ABC-type polysaccharide/polyol phosphate export permease